MNNALGRALGAPKLKKIVPRGSGTAKNGCPEVPRRAQRGKKRVPGDPQGRFWDPNMTTFRGFWGPNGELFGENLVKMDAKNREILKTRKVIKKQLKKLIVFY